jgi:hypothetical protein
MTERRLPPVVEPLSDAAWARVERGLWRRVDDQAATSAPRTQRWWWLAVGPLTAATAVAAIVLVRRPPAVELAVRDEPSRVVSGAAPSSASFGDVHVELDTDTALVMTHEAAQPVAVLERGAAWFTVAPRRQRPAFVMRAGDTTVRVIGTRFRVVRSGELSTVDVERGLVEVQFRGRELLVGAGQRWSSASPTLLATRPAGSPPPSPTTSEPVARPGRVATPAIDRERADYDRLAALEPSSPEAALAGYLALARGDTAWAAPALYAAARLAVDRDDPRAHALLARYLSQFPGGANAADARQLLARRQRDPR